MRRMLLAGTAGAAALGALGAAACAQTAAWDGSVRDGSVRDGAVQTGADAAADSRAGLAVRPQDWAGFAHVGYHLDPHWRVELQGGYKAGAATPASNFGPLCAAPLAGMLCGPRERALGAYSAVANLVYEARPDSRWFDPFAAFGAGFSRPDPGANQAVDPAMQILQMDTRSPGLAYQALVGLAFRPHDRLHLDLTYRWMGAVGETPTGLPMGINSRYYQDQTVAISVRYALSSPRRAIPPVPAAFSAGLGFASAGLGRPQAGPPTRTVVVETPANPAALAAEAEAAVRQADAAAAQGQGSHVVVDGHADTASTADYNSRLSERRAKAMADSMAALGVPVPALAIRWDGADAPGPDDVLARQ